MFFLNIKLFNELLSDILFLQIKDESFIEDINLLLNTGDLPGLYTNEEKAEILEKIQLVAKEEVSFFLHYNYSSINI